MLVTELISAPAFSANCALALLASSAVMANQLCAGFSDFVLPISAFVLAGLPTTKIFASSCANLPIASPWSVKIPPLIFSRSLLSSIFFPSTTIPLGMLPTKRTQCASLTPSLISAVASKDPVCSNPQSISSMMVPSSLSTT